MSMALLSRLVNVLVALVVGVSRPLVLEVILVVVGESVLVGCWLRACDLGSIVSQVVVHQVLLLVHVNVHIFHG